MCYLLWIFLWDSKDFILQQLEAGKNVILEIEVQGAMQVKNIIKDSYMILLRFLQ